MNVDKIAERIIAKWLKKGNMARCMRDILPSSNLSVNERNLVAEIVHHVVRFKNLYDFVMENEGFDKNPKNYVELWKNRKILEKYSRIAFRMGLAEVYYSSSPIVARILSSYPKFAEKINQESRTCLAVNIGRISMDEAIKKLKKECCRVKKCTPETCIEAEPQARYSSLIKKGLAIVQDASSQHVAKIVASLGESILDFCAGSGGKSFTMKFFNPSLQIFVNDIDEGKINTLFRRARILNLQFKKFDEERKYDAVLVDAPCSGLGSAARNPEAKYREDLSEFPKLQMKILDHAKNFVEKGGFLVYVVCTFNPDETYGVVEKFLEENGDFHEFALSAGKIYFPDRIGGFITSGDIFYVAILKKE